MLKHKGLLLSMVAAAVVRSALYMARNFNIGALQRPSRAETFLATKAKHWLVARAVRREKLAEPDTASLSVATGRSFFQACCSMCLTGASSGDT